MNELRAAEVFNELWAIRPASENVNGALSNLADSRLSDEEHAAVVHYAEQGGSQVLADRARRIVAAAMAAAEAIAPRSAQPGLAEPGTLRRAFQDSMAVVQADVDARKGADRARRLAEAMTYRNAKVPELVKRVNEDRVDAWMAVRDLADAAAYGALLAEQLTPTTT